MVAPESALPRSAPENSSGSEIAARLDRVRRGFNSHGVDALLVRSTDPYLNEYVPAEESQRIWISGFTGSMGEVVVTRAHAYVAVDGRYWLQAEREMDPALYSVWKVPHGTSLDTALADHLLELAGEQRMVVGYDPARLTPAELEFFAKRTQDRIEWKPLNPFPVDRVRGPLPLSPPAIRVLDEARLGATVTDKLRELARSLKGHGLDGLLIQRLDEIAYLSNLRGAELPYQATFKSIALATADRLYLGLRLDTLPPEARAERPAIEFLPEAEIGSVILPGQAIGIDPNHNTELARQAIEERGAKVVPIASPIGPMKAKKNGAELAAMVRAFAKADQVVSRASTWLCAEVAAGVRVTEADFAARVTRLFEESGAVGLSFRVISAAGENGAIIHYSDPSPERVIRSGELMLLDTGAYYEEGYATDLTRTFLVGGRDVQATALQKRNYTLVLKAAVAGMSAVFPEGAKGAQLDAICRAPLWAEGLDFAHGTGHGVGVNVHESPPRIGPNAQTVIETGHVFSIEPGLYQPSFGGVRIENLCTVEPAQPGFLRVRPLTFSPLDSRLIDEALLEPKERAWLARYAAGVDAYARG